MDLNEAVISEYLQSLTGKNEDTLQRERSIIVKFIKYLEEHGITAPTEPDIDAYSQALQAQGTNADTARRYINRIKGCLEWVKYHQQNFTGCSSMEEITAKENTETREVRRSTGRPKRTDGKENRSHKWSIYFTPTMFNELNELSRFNGYSITELITRIAQEYIDGHRNELVLFREAREKALKKQSHADS
ncbi:MAG: hypothetical protein IJ725_00255 [Ruminococcus sp.]|nr:hypothetical protein [Ruminococcus sp.]